MTGLPEAFFIAPDGEVVNHAIGVLPGEQLGAGVAATRSGQAISPLTGGDQRSTR